MTAETFEAELFCGPEKGAWTFILIPAPFCPDAAGPWGRTPIRATVDGRSWDTSAWRAKTGEWYLPVPKKIRRGKEAGETVVAGIQPRSA